MSENNFSIKILRADNLGVFDITGSSDPYCVCTCESNKPFKTSVKKKNLCPQWNETWNFHIDNDTLKQNPEKEFVKIEIFDKDLLKKDDFMGFATLTGKQLLENRDSGRIFYLVLKKRAGASYGSEEGKGTLQIFFINTTLAKPSVELSKNDNNDNDKESIVVKPIEKISSKVPVSTWKEDREALLKTMKKYYKWEHMGREHTLETPLLNEGFVFVVVAKDDGPDAPPRPPPAFAHDRGFEQQHFPHYIGAWNSKTKKYVDQQHIGTVWNFEHAPTVAEVLELWREQISVERGPFGSTPSVANEDGGTSDRCQAKLRGCRPPGDEGDDPSIVAPPALVDNVLKFSSYSHTGMSGSFWDAQRVVLPKTNKDGISF